MRLPQPLLYPRIYLTLESPIDFTLFPQTVSFFGGGGLEQLRDRKNRAFLFGIYEGQQWLGILMSYQGGCRPYRQVALESTRFLVDKVVCELLRVILSSYLTALPCFVVVQLRHIPNNVGIKVVELNFLCLEMKERRQHFLNQTRVFFLFERVKYTGV